MVSPSKAIPKRFVSKRIAYLLAAVVLVFSISTMQKKVEEDKATAVQAAVRAAVQKSVMEVKEEMTKEKDNAVETAVQAAVTEAKQEMAKGNAIAVRDAVNVDTCRDVFKSQGQGGIGEMNVEKTLKTCQHPLLFNVCDDLKKFTGLTDDEFNKRLTRKGRFHFEGEHAFWNPTSATELAWYYTTSIDYLFANAIHLARENAFGERAEKKYEPFLDYSGGVGNNILYLAEKGVKVQYFGIGMAEYAFAQYRVWKNGLNDMVEFKKPFNSKDHSFDPIHGPLPLDGSLGTILAFDVLEHIPNYSNVVDAMVKSIRVGGLIIENSPFAKDKVQGEDEDLRVHVSNGGISMTQAMGPSMKLIEHTAGFNVWEKIDDGKSSTIDSESS